MAIEYKNKIEKFRGPENKTEYLMSLYIYIDEKDI